MFWKDRQILFDLASPQSPSSTCERGTESLRGGVLKVVFLIASPDIYYPSPSFFVTFPDWPPRSSCLSVLLAACPSHSRVSFSHVGTH